MATRRSKRLRGVPNVEEALDVPDRIEGFFLEAFPYIPVELLDIVFHQYLTTHIEGRWERPIPEPADFFPVSTYMFNVSYDMDAARYSNEFEAELGGTTMHGNPFNPYYARLVSARNDRERVLYGDVFIDNSSWPGGSRRRSMWDSHHVCAPPGAWPGACLIIARNTSPRWGGSRSRPQRQLAIVSSLAKRPTVNTDKVVRARLSDLELPRSTRDISWNVRWAGFHHSRQELGWMELDVGGVMNWVVVAFRLSKGDIDQLRLTRCVALKPMGCKNGHWPAPGYSECGTCTWPLTCSRSSSRCRFSYDMNVFYYGGTLFVVSHWVIQQYDWDGQLLRRLPICFPPCRDPDTIKGCSVQIIRADFARQIRGSRSCLEVCVRSEVSSPRMETDLHIRWLLF